MNARVRLLVMIGVLVAAAGVAVLLARAPGAHQPEVMAALAGAPGADLVFRDGDRLDRILAQRSPLGRATESTWYGTDAGDGTITAFFDAELASRGYAPAPLDAVASPTDPGDPMRELGKYVRDGYTYRILVAPLPRRVGGRSISLGYRHFLITQLSVD